jgi:threonine/homoserine/homoserine lactone efflux protein
MSPEFLFTAFVVCALPGIGVVYTLSMALGGGLRAGLLAALGCTIVTALHLGFALLGLAAILHASALLFQAIKWAGVLYLLWMAWGALGGEGALQVRAAPPPSALRMIGRGILLNLLNPKLPQYFLAFVPQFVPAAAPDASAMLIELGLTFTAMTFAVFALYALAAGSVRRRLLESRRAMAWLRRAFAASFALLGARLALERA